MFGVILAAGEGSRFELEIEDYDSAPELIPSSDSKFEVRYRKISKHKLLAEIFSMSLIERSIRLLWKAGVEKCVVVTGFARDKVETEALRVSQELGFPVEVVFNPRWKEGNATSLLTAKDSVHGNFVLIMCDHIHSIESVKKIMECSEFLNENAQVILATSKRYSIVDVDEACKVLIQEKNEKTGKIGGIGKDLKTYNAIDTGLFLCSYEIFGYTERYLSSQDGPAELWAVMKHVAKSGKLYSCDIEGSFWADIDTYDDLKRARKTLFREAQLELGGDVIYMNINRFFSRFLTKLFVKTPLSPNVITVITFFMAVISSFLFFMGYIVIGGIVVQVLSIMDGTGREAARLRMVESKWGAIFGSIMDTAADSFIIVGIALLELSGLVPKPLPTLEVLAWTFSALVILPLSTLQLSKYKAETSKTWLEKGILAYLPTGRDGRLFIIFILSILRETFLAIEIITIITLLHTVARLIIWKKELPR
jgi:CDP-L-myo-inositol myo-inositolphosphotransferase